MSKPTQALVKQLELRIEKLTQANQTLQEQVNLTNQVQEATVSLSTALDFDTIVAKAVSFAKHLNATFGEIHLQTGTGDIYFTSSHPAQNEQDNTQWKEQIRRVLDEGLDAWVLKTGQLALVLDTQKDHRWLSVEYPDKTVSVRSAICAPIKAVWGQLKGAISFVHPEPNHFNKQSLTLLGTVATHIIAALENAYQVKNIEDNLNEAHLMLDISKHLTGTSNLRNLHTALAKSVSASGADHCTLFTCQGLSSNNLPTHAKITFIGDIASPKSKHNLLNYHFSLEEYPALFKLVQDKETLVIENLAGNERLSDADKALLSNIKVCSMVINPLVTRTRVTGFLAIAYKTNHLFTERELAIYRTLCNQTAVALEHVRQIKHTENALAETQTLYRAGRVLAGTQGLQEILQEALVEFVYGLGLEQGEVVLLSPDKQFGQLMVYLDEGEIQPIEPFKFQLDMNLPNQQTLLSGQPFADFEILDQSQLVEFSNLSLAKPIKSILQAPMIMEGETIGWIGVNAVREHRSFNQREMDLGRAMADQTTIAIQNRRLLEQAERRAEQLRVVATVGEAVTGLTDLGKVLELTVNLIRDRFGFYHVSIFLIDENREWAVVKASTGKVGKIMVNRPHRLGVGSNSIVGFATHNAKPRIALDVGKDAVHFDNPLLPDTRSEMALPMISRGFTIGALDVQSVEANAFSDEDIETLQVMADQVTTAIETARLFEETQQRLHEQAMLYRIGTKIGGTLNLQQTTNILVQETAQMLNVAKCTLTLLEEANNAFTISNYVKEGSTFYNHQGKRFKVDEFLGLPQILADKQEFIYYVDDEKITGRELDHLKKYGGTVMVFVPILLRNDVIGLLEIYDDQPARRISYTDINLLDSVAMLAANAIENARLFETAHESQAFMKAVINQIPDPIFIKDRDHKWVVANSAFAEGISGSSKDSIIGRNDYGFSPGEETDLHLEQDNNVFKTGEAQELENTIVDSKGNLRTLFTRKIPLAVKDTKPEYIIGVIQDITKQKQRETERERLIEETRHTLERTQTLYQISSVLATTTHQQTTFEKVLGEYLGLLEQEQGTVMLFNKASSCNIAQTRYIKGQPVEPNLVLPLDQDLVFQHLFNKPAPLVIKNPGEHPLTKAYAPTQSHNNVLSMLFIPLIIRGTLSGNIVIEATEKGYIFNKNDIEIGQAIAGQLAIWLENRQLLNEAQHRSDSLQTTADVAHAASSILNINELIETSVNLIRNQFNFYYVGLFLVDNAGQWAVLKAGTGEPGRIQLAKNHKLEIGGASMIGRSIEKRKARITLDVGKEAVHFRNPILPDTRSEMALPLISRDEVLGALTVQSTQHLAFSDEDITLLQTMADQLANAISNANLFTKTQNALAEAEILYQVSQAISSAREEQLVYQLAVEAIGQSGIDSAVIYTYVQEQTDEGVEEFIEQKAVWSAGTDPALSNNTRLKTSNFVIEQLVSHQKTVLLEDIENNPQLTNTMRQALNALKITSLLILPLSTHQERIGFLLISYKNKEKEFTKNQFRYFNIISQQMVVSLENLRLLDDSQKRASREEIIRDVTEKIRNATGVNNILKTTVTELGKIIGTTQGSITLNIVSEQKTTNSTKN